MKKIFNIAKLSFTSGVHLGSGTGEEYDRSMRILHSDTISAALCSNWATSDKDVEGFMRSFRVSSAIPMYNNRVFLPLPLDKSCITLAEYPDGSQHKRIKRLQWIEQPLWEKLSREGKIEISISMISGCGTAIALEDAKDICIQKQALEQKVAVINGEDNEPYYFDRIFFGKGVKLGVLYESSRTQDFENTFTLLADSGIGTRRTVGNGLFSTEFDTIEIDVTEEADGIQLLSLWLPKNEEWCVETMSNSCYDIISRGGFTSGSSDATQRNRIKKSVNMVVAGSVIATTALEGNIVDVRPEGFVAHPVWRDGRAFYLPFKKLYNNEM